MTDGAAGTERLVPAALVATLAYKPGWKFKIGGPLNGYLCVFATTPDSNNPVVDRTTQHMFQIPAFYGNPSCFYRWVFHKLLLCEQHEAGEFFRVADRRPFMPHHQDEGSPYELVERWEP